MLLGDRVPEFGRPEMNVVYRVEIGVLHVPGDCPGKRLDKEWG